MISDETYAVYRAAIDRANAWVGERLSYAAIDTPDYVRNVTNAIRGEVEVYELHRDKPAKVYAYATIPNETGMLPWDRTVRHGRRGTITTWPGDALGTFSVRSVWRDRHGGWRCSLVAALPGIGLYTGQWAYTAQDCLTLKTMAGRLKPVVAIPPATD